MQINLDSLAASCRLQLLTPWWFMRAIDEKYGGVLTMMSGTGDRIGTDKYISYGPENQGRGGLSLRLIRTSYRKYEAGVVGDSSIRKSLEDDYNISDAMRLSDPGEVRLRHFASRLRSEARTLPKCFCAGVYLRIR